MPYSSYLSDVRSVFIMLRVSD